MTFVLMAVLVGCPGGSAEAGKQEKEAASAMRPHARDDHATTTEAHKVHIEMVANDSGKSLEIDKVKARQAHGDIICEAEIETGKLRSCDYTPANGFSGKDEFTYTVQDTSGQTDSGKVYVRVRPAD